MIIYNFTDEKMNTSKFQKVFETELGQELWAFMQTDLVVRSLILATHLNKSPVAAISDLLLERFGITESGLTPKERLEQGFARRYTTGTPIRFDRIKQYIGLLVKVILFTHGCIISSRNATANDPLKIFANSARYSDPAFNNLVATAT